MEEKEISWKHNPLRSFPRFRYSSSLLFRKTTSSNRRSTFLEKGFSLIELIIVIALLGILFLVLSAVINPIEQFQKRNDTRRDADLFELRNALDTYYNDHNCYPLTLNSLVSLTSQEESYIQKIPKDPRTDEEYSYTGGTELCPQWYVLFANYETRGSQDESVCSLSETCLPQNYENSWGCQVGGNIEDLDCSYISEEFTLNTGENPAPTNSPTPTPQDSCSKDYLCSQGACNRVPDGTGDYCTSNCDGFCQ